MKNIHIKQELANSLTHGVAFLLFLVSSPLLIAYAAKFGSVGNVVATVIFSFTVLITYLSSTLYHSIPNPKVKHVLRIFDHISIFLLIGGSYTLFLQLFKWDLQTKVLLGILWSLILCGSIFKIFFVKKYNVASTIIYLALGFYALFFIKAFFISIPTTIFILIAVGGLIYALGTIFYLWKGWTYNHAIWHLFVVGGTTIHFIAALIAVYKYLPLL